MLCPRMAAAAKASCSLTMKMSVRSKSSNRSVAGSVGGAGAKFQILQPPAVRTRRATLRASGKGTSIWKTAIVELSIKYDWIDASVSVAFAPLATVIAFSPNSSTVTNAQPVGSVQTVIRSVATPLRARLSRADRPNASSPTQAAIRLFAAAMRGPQQPLGSHPFRQTAFHIAETGPFRQGVEPRLRGLRGQC